MARGEKISGTESHCEGGASLGRNILPLTNGGGDATIEKGRTWTYLDSAKLRSKGKATSFPQGGAA